jgi:hypothetical protein
MLKDWHDGAPVAPATANLYHAILDLETEEAVLRMRLSLGARLRTRDRLFAISVSAGHPVALGMSPPPPPPAPPPPLAAVWGWASAASDTTNRKEKGQLLETAYTVMMLSIEGGMVATMKRTQEIIDAASVSVVARRPKAPSQIRHATSGGHAE